MYSLTLERKAFSWIPEIVRGGKGKTLRLKSSDSLNPSQPLPPSLFPLLQRALTVSVIIHRTNPLVGQSYTRWPVWSRYRVTSKSKKLLKLLKLLRTQLEDYWPVVKSVVTHLDLTHAWVLGINSLCLSSPPDPHKERQQTNSGIVGNRVVCVGLEVCVCIGWVWPSLVYREGRGKYKEGSLLRTHTFISSDPTDR